MVLVALLASALVPPITVVVAYADATRLGRPSRERLLSALAVGAGSVSGFVLPHRYEDVLVRAYLHAVKSGPVVTSPSELLMVHLAIGMGISVASVLLYAVAVRRDG